MKIVYQRDRFFAAGYSVSRLNLQFGAKRDIALAIFGGFAYDNYVLGLFKAFMAATPFRLSFHLTFSRPGSIDIHATMISPLWV